MIDAHIELILIVTGAITAIALLQFIAPTSVLRMIFGEAPTDKVGLAVARHWGLLTFWSGDCSFMQHFILRFGAPRWSSP
jgi:hypothetical protein